MKQKTIVGKVYASQKPTLRSDDVVARDARDPQLSEVKPREDALNCNIWIYYFLLAFLVGVYIHCVSLDLLSEPDRNIALDTTSSQINDNHCSDKSTQSGIPIAR